MTWSNGLTAEGGWLNGSQHGKITLTLPSTDLRDFILDLTGKEKFKEDDNSLEIVTDWTHGSLNLKSEVQFS